MAILPLDHNPGIFPAFRVVDGQNDHAAVMADDVANALPASRLNQPVAHHPEERSLEDHLRANQFSLLLHRGRKRLGSLLRLGLRGFLHLDFGCLLRLGPDGFLHLEFGCLLRPGLRDLCFFGFGGLCGFLLLGHLFSPWSAIGAQSDNMRNQIKSIRTLWPIVCESCLVHQFGPAWHP